MIILIALITSNCSINKMVTNKLADRLASPEGGEVFTGDDDPELIKDALPFALKLYESLLQSVPDNEELLLATGKAYCMYAYAFIHFEADMLPQEESEKKEKMMKRTKKLYIRGRNYIIRALELRYEGFTNKLKENKLNTILTKTEKEDVPYLFWAGMAWVGAFSVDPFDMELSITRPKAVAMIDRAYKLDPSFENGSIDNFYISYYGSIPKDIGGSEEKAREHYKRALKITKGLQGAPYLNLASSVCIQKQKQEEFEELCNKVIEIDIEKDPKNRLVNVLMQRKAQYMLDHLDDYFLEK